MLFNAIKSIMYVFVCVCVSHLVMSDSLWPPWTVCSLPGSSAHGISQARILEWGVITFSRGSSWPQGSNPGLLHCRQIFYRLSHQRSPMYVFRTFQKEPGKERLRILIHLTWNMVRNGKSQVLPRIIGSEPAMVTRWFTQTSQIPG